MSIQLNLLLRSGYRFNKNIAPDMLTRKYKPPTQYFARHTVEEITPKRKQILTIFWILFSGFIFEFLQDDHKNQYIYMNYCFFTVVRLTGKLKQS